MSITASDVKELRARTGAGMMDCKKALGESEGDMEAALDYLRKKGLATAEKRKDRVAKEGLVRIHVDGAVGGMVEVNCETDFVARNEEFEALATALAAQVVEKNPASLDELQSQPIAGGASAETRLADLVGKIGEKMLVSRFRHITLDGPGVVEPYLHAGGRVGVLVALTTSSEEIAAKPEFRETAHELALHVAFASPVCTDRSAIPADLVERERRISRERALEQGKPEKIVDKIVEGQINKYFAEVVLLEQTYVKEDKTAVKKWLAAQGQTLGGEIEVAAFARFALGEAAEEAAEA